jgi:hypothetical protein
VVVREGKHVPFNLEWESRGVIVTYWGRVLPEQVLICNRQIVGDRRCDDLRFVILDTLAVHSLSFSRQDLEEIEAFLQGPAWTNPNINLAVVATLPAVLHALDLYEATGTRTYMPAVCESTQAARAMVKPGARVIARRATRR